MTLLFKNNLPGFIDRVQVTNTRYLFQITCHNNILH